MHPHEFVAKMIASERAVELAEMLLKYSSNQQKLKRKGQEEVYNFMFVFAISVAGQLRLLPPGKTVDDDDFLRVWQSLGFWGIKREEIAEYLKIIGF